MSHEKNPFAPVPFKGWVNFVDDLLNRNLTDFIGGDFPVNQPSVNIVENKDHYRMELAAPGFKKEDFNIHIDRENLKISAKKEQNEEVESERFMRKEFSFAAFERTFKLPETVNSENIAAKYENGVLLLTLPKRESHPAAVGKVISVD